MTEETPQVEEQNTDAPVDAPVDAPADAQATPNDLATNDQTQLIAALEERLAALEAAKNEAQEAARVAGLSAEERLNEELAKLQGEREIFAREQRDTRRNAALDRLGVLDKYRQFAPDVDVSDAKGARQLEQWVTAHPELIARKDAAKPTRLSNATEKSSALRDILSGKRKNPLVNKRSLAAMFGE